MIEEAFNLTITSLPAYFKDVCFASSLPYSLVTFFMKLYTVWKSLTKKTNPKPHKLTPKTQVVTRHCHL